MIIRRLIRKNLFRLFESLNFDIKIDMNLKVVQCLDVEFNLSTGTVSAYMKPNSLLKYVNTKSTHSVSVLKYNPMGAECRISRTVSTTVIFNHKRKFMNLH